jgi:hypothetical protein
MRTKIYAAALAVLAIVSPVRAQRLFEGARLITGDGRVIENSAFVVTGNQILQVGHKAKYHPAANVSI